MQNLNPPISDIRPPYGHATTENREISFFCVSFSSFFTIERRPQTRQASARCLACLWPFLVSKSSLTNSHGFLPHRDCCSWAHEFVATDFAAAESSIFQQPTASQNNCQACKKIIEFRGGSSVLSLSSLPRISRANAHTVLFLIFLQASSQVQIALLFGHMVISSLFCQTSLPRFHCSESSDSSRRTSLIKPIPTLDPSTLTRP